MPEFSDLLQTEVDHSCWVSRKQTWGYRGAAAGGQAYEHAEGVGIPVKVRGRECAVSVSKDGMER